MSKCSEHVSGVSKSHQWIGVCLCACGRLAKELNIRRVCEGNDSEGGAALSSPRSTFHCCSSLASHTHNSYTHDSHTQLDHVCIYLCHVFSYMKLCFHPSYEAQREIWTSPNAVVVAFWPIDLITTKIEQKSTSTEIQRGALDPSEGEGSMRSSTWWSVEVPTKQNTAKVWVCPSREAAVSLRQSLRSHYCQSNEKVGLLRAQCSARWHTGEQWRCSGGAVVSSHEPRWSVSSHCRRPGLQSRLCGPAGLLEGQRHSSGSWCADNHHAHLLTAVSVRLVVCLLMCRLGRRYMDGFCHPKERMNTFFCKDWTNCC